jgi:hypothetical protein
MHQTDNARPPLSSLLNPVIVPGQIESFDWATNTAVVITNVYGKLQCRIGTEYSDTDWEGSQAEQDNTQFGAKRPYYARERVLVLLMGGSRVADGVVVCSISTTNNKLNTETQVKGEHQDDPYEIEGKRVLHIRDDYWLRTIKTVMQIAVEDMLLRSESGRVDVDAYTDIKLRAKEENVTIDAEKQSVAVHAKQDITLNAEQDWTVTVTRNASVTAQGTALYKSTGGTTVEAGGSVIVKSPSLIQLGSAPTDPIAKATELLAAIDAMMVAFVTWSTGHIHPVICVGAPSGPGAVPGIAVQQAWNALKDLIASTLVKVER